MDGGYDDGYRNCPCFWGREPGSLILKLQTYIPEFQNLRILDAGCGEGKNASYLAKHGAVVRAMDASEIAISNARDSWGEMGQVTWEVEDVRQVSLPSVSFDVVIAYGLLHCLRSSEEMIEVVNKLKNATKPGGYNVICAFNDRYQDLTAHPGFVPCLISHASFLAMYSEWDVLEATDSDLHEQHPHNNIEHTHSMTRLIAQHRGVR